MAEQTTESPGAPIADRPAARRRGHRARAFAILAVVVVGVITFSLAPIPQPDPSGALRGAPHVVAYAILMGLLLTLIGSRLDARRSASWAVVLTLGACLFLLGAAVELGQSLVGRDVEIADVVANAIGIGLAVLAWILVDALRTRRIRGRAPDRGETD